MATMDNAFISRQEAAGILGVSDQTISNYVKKGLFKSKTMSGLVYIEREGFDRYKDRLVKVADNEKRLQEYEQELLERERELGQQLDELTRQCRSMVRYVRKLNTREDIAHNIMMRYASEVIDEYGNFLWEYNVLDNRTLGQFAEEYGRNAKVMSNKIQGAIADMVERMKQKQEAEEKLDDLQRRCFRQHEYIKELEMRLHKAGVNKPNSERGYVNARRIALLETKVVDLEFPVRTLNCLKYAGIETLEQLVRMSKKEVLKMRNFGRKFELMLEEDLERMGLSLGMDVEEYIHGED